MMTLILGQPSSGKSLKAEALAQASDCRHKVYLATMKVMDEDGERRVARHRAQREGKGFETLEIPANLECVISKLEEPKETVVLLECLSNLVGNEMHDNKTMADLPDEEFAEAIASKVRSLADAVGELIVVSTTYETKEEYDEETKRYIRLLDATNERVKKITDRVEE